MTLFVAICSASSRKRGVPPADTEFLVSNRGLQLMVGRCADIVCNFGTSFPSVFLLV